MSPDSKKMIRISLFYGVIVVIANFLGVIIPRGIQSPLMRSDYMNDWLIFLDDYVYITDPIQYFSFAIPIIMCFLYARSTRSNAIARFINLPIAYSTIGITGWIIYYIEEIILVFSAIFLGYDLEIPKILIASLFFVFMEAIIAFTFAFFIMETLHRRVFLPKMFPGGQISLYTSKLKFIKPSIKLLCIINYCSVTMFPILYLFIMYYSVAQKSGIFVVSSAIVVFIIIIIMGLIITWSFQNYFDEPLKKFKIKIQKIKEGDYLNRVNVITNDELGELSDTLNEMSDSIQEKTLRIIEAQNSVITGMAIMVESRDNSTGGHIKRTSDCVKIFSKALSEDPQYSTIDKSFFDAVIKAAPMHDLGKIAVDDAILRKPGRFTDEEYEIMKIHASEGAKIVSSVLCNIDDEKFKQIAENVAHYHHEKWDGQGYPQRISGEQIPLEARIMALADVFDALVSKRCYKDSFSYDKAFNIIQESLGSHFDPSLGAIFLKCRSSLEKLYDSY